MRNRGFAYLSILLIILSYTLSSCVSTSNTLSKSGIEKRRYTKGYHIDFATRHESHKDSESEGQLVKNHPVQARIQKVLVRAATKKIQRMNRSLGSAGAPAQRTSPSASSEGQLDRQDRMHQFSQSDSLKCGDEIIFRSGDRVMAKVISVGVKDITYRTCDSLTGPTYVTERSAVHTIEYANGQKDVFDKEPEEEYYVQDEYLELQVESTEKLAVASLVLGILSIALIPYFGFVLGIVAIVLGRKALTKIQNSEGKLNGKGQAKTGAILGIVSVGLTTIASILVILLLLVWAI